MELYHCIGTYQQTQKVQKRKKKHDNSSTTVIIQDRRRHSSSGSEDFLTGKLQIHHEERTPPAVRNI